MVAFYAHTIEVLDGDGNTLVTHPRQYGDVRTDTSDYSTSLAVLLKNVGAWHNSGVRADAPEMLREFMDKLPKPVGLGKTHMAIAAGIEACKQGYKTKFFTVTGLVLELTEAKKNNVLEKFMKNIQSLDLLILDEWGYVPIDREASQLLYRVIDDCYENTSMIITTNLEFSKWSNIYTDSQMTAAIIDRIVHHGYLLIFEGRSYRVEHALMRQETEGIAPKTKVISKNIS